MAQNLTDKTILIVDDDPDILTAITTALADTGATLKTCTDGSSAVAQVEKLVPNLMILDIMLPQKSGFLVLEQMRQKIPREKRPRVIMITGNAGQRHRQYAEALGVDDYINKPFRMERLVESIEKLLTAQ